MLRLLFYRNLVSQQVLTNRNNIENININWNNYLGPIEVYIDKAWINYEKIYGDKVFGSRFYTSIYTELFETGITYEYKNYHTPYLIKSISNPPIVYKEGTSILASRNSHSMNFGNELGHQIDLNRNLFHNLNLPLQEYSFDTSSFHMLLLGLEAKYDPWIGSKPRAQGQCSFWQQRQTTNWKSTRFPRRRKVKSPKLKRCQTITGHWLWNYQATEQTSDP